jgi:hypothetical protein
MRDLARLRALAWHFNVYWTAIGGPESSIFWLNQWSAFSCPEQLADIDGLQADGEKGGRHHGEPHLTLEEWIVEAVPAYFDETVGAVQTAIQDAKTAVAKRSSAPYAKPK